LSNLDSLYRDLVSPPEEPSVPGRKNITLRLSRDTHTKLDDIRALGTQSKTVMAEELLISAIEDVHRRMMTDEGLESWWADRAEQLHDQEQEAIEQAICDAARDNLRMEVA